MCYVKLFLYLSCSTIDSRITLPAKRSVKQMACCGSRPSSSNRARVRETYGTVVAAPVTGSIEALPALTAASGGVGHHGSKQTPSTAGTSVLGRDSEPALFTALRCSVAEQTAVAELRQRLSIEGGVSRPPDEMLLRFLRANLQPYRARQVLRSHLAWRQRWQPESITATDIPTALGSGQTRVLGRSRRGAFREWVYSCKHDTADVNTMGRRPASVMVASIAVETR
jgi:hypothetical protein